MEMKTKQEIFNILIEENLGMLRAAAYRFLHDPDEVDEAVQEALLTAWNKFDQFRQTAKLSSWVYRITVNISCDRLRKRQKESEKLRQYAEAEQASHNADDPGDVMLTALSEAVAELPDLYREAVTVGCLGGFSADDAASLLGCSVNTLYQRVHKAKQMLKEKLEVPV